MEIFYLRNKMIEKLGVYIVVILKINYISFIDLVVFLFIINELDEDVVINYIFINKLVISFFD